MTLWSVCVHVLLLSICTSCLSAFRVQPKSIKSYTSNGEVDTLVAMLKKTPKMEWTALVCGEWDEWCVPYSKQPAHHCCSGYTCKCNLWNTNCRCKAKLFNG